MKCNGKKGHVMLVFEEHCVGSLVVFEFECESQAVAVFAAREQLACYAWDLFFGFVFGDVNRLYVNRAQRHVLEAQVVLVVPRDSVDAVGVGFLREHCGHVVGISCLNVDGHELCAVFHEAPAHETLEPPIVCLAVAPAGLQFAVNALVVDINKVITVIQLFNFCSRA